MTVAERLARLVHWMRSREETRDDHHSRRQQIYEIKEIYDMFVEKLFETFGLGRVFVDRSFLFDIPIFTCCSKNMKRKERKENSAPKKKLSRETLS